MDGIKGITLKGPPPYYLNRGTGGSGVSKLSPYVQAHNAGVGGPSLNVQVRGMHTPVFRPHSEDTKVAVQQNLGSSGGGAGSCSNLRVENPSPGSGLMQGMSMAMVPGTSQGGETVKKKRGRPRKYGPDGANMSLGLSPMKPSSGEVTPGEKGRRGRPPGSGWKQNLAPLGEWMNSSAGLAFKPHVLHVGVGEDVAAKVLAFSQQRPRALCILSGNGTLSAVTLRQPTTSGGTITYEGHFEILCLSGSYLVTDDGGPNRTGGISISVCSPDGHIIGGAIGGRLIAANPVQVVACSFVYGNTTTKGKSKSESETKEETNLLDQSAERSSTPVISTPVQMVTPNSGTSGWQSSCSMPDTKDSGIDLTCG